MHSLPRRKLLRLCGLVRLGSVPRRHVLFGLVRSLCRMPSWDRVGLGRRTCRFDLCCVLTGEVLNNRRLNLVRILRRRDLCFIGGLSELRNLCGRRFPAGDRLDGMHLVPSWHLPGQHRFDGM